MIVLARMQNTERFPAHPMVTIRDRFTEAAGGRQVVYLENYSKTGTEILGEEGGMDVFIRTNKITHLSSGSAHLK